MVDTARTRAALQTLLADNTAGDISAQDLRDLLVSGAIGTDQTEGLLRFTDAQLNNAQIKALKASPVTLIPAQGAGYGILVDKIQELWHLPVAYDSANLAGTGYSPNFADLGVLFSLGVTQFGQDAVEELPTDHDMIFVVETGLTTGSAAALINAYGNSWASQLDNSPFVIVNDSASEYTGGGAANTLSLRIWWRQIRTVPFGGA